MKGNIERPVHSVKIGKFAGWEGRLASAQWERRRPRVQMRPSGRIDLQP
jgi:hypothetical protein